MNLNTDAATYTAQEFAQLAGVSLSSVHRAAHAGKLTEFGWFRVGNRLLFPRVKVDAVLAPVVEQVS